MSRKYRCQCALAQANYWQRAREVIATIEESSLRAQALCELGQTLVQANHRQQARHVWKLAQEIIATIPSHTRGEKLRGLAEAFARANYWRETQEVMLTLEDNYERARALCVLGLTRAQANHEQQARQAWRQAQEIIATIPVDIGREIQKGTALIVLSQTLIQANHEQQAIQIWQEAQKVIALYPDHSSLERDEVLRELAEAFARANYWQEAKGVIAAIYSTDEKIAAFKALSFMPANLWIQAQEASSTGQRDLSHNTNSTQEKVDRYLQLLDFLQHHWLHLTNYKEALLALSLAHGFVLLKPALVLVSGAKRSW